MGQFPPSQANFVEAGSGPTVVLVHSSACGARQWRRLMDELKDEFHVRAVNLYGYGGTAPWSFGKPQSLDDQARLVEERCRQTPRRYVLSDIASADRLR